MTMELYVFPWHRHQLNPFVLLVVVVQLGPCRTDPFWVCECVLNATNCRFLAICQSPQPRAPAGTQAHPQFCLTRLKYLAQNETKRENHTQSRKKEHKVMPRSSPYTAVVVYICNFLIHLPRQQQFSLTKIEWQKEINAESDSMAKVHRRRFVVLYNQPSIYRCNDLYRKRFDNTWHNSGC